MSVIFLNSHRGKSGILNGKKLSTEYILACKFFDCGIIDRTETLDVGFDQKVLDPIPVLDKNLEQLRFGQICDDYAVKIIQEAIQKNIGIQVLWSGGIDSTVALVALIKNIPEAHQAKLQVTLSMDSINEYPDFFRRFILKNIPFNFIQPPITDHLSEQALIVTGEHGDQLFGSDKLLPLISNQLAFEDWETILPIYLTNKFNKTSSVDKLIQYLTPMIQSCPNKIVSMFDLFWWLNFTIKWQQVSLRIPVFSFQDNVQSLSDRFRHFFRDPSFQLWSLQNHEHRMVESLVAYKQPAKDYIFDFTGDETYLKEKSKEPSLKHIILDRSKQGNKRYRIMMGEDYNPVIEVFHKNFKNKNINHEGI